MMVVQLHFKTFRNHLLKATELQDPSSAATVNTGQRKKECGELSWGPSLFILLLCYPSGQIMGRSKSQAARLWLGISLWAFMLGPKAILNVCIGMWLLISRCQRQCALQEGVRWERQREEGGATEASASHTVPGGGCSNVDGTTLAPTGLAPRRCCAWVSTVQSRGLGVRAESGIGGRSPECPGMPSAKSDGWCMLCRLKPLEPHVKTTVPHVSVRLVSENQQSPASRQDWAHSSRLDVPVPTPEPVNVLMHTAQGTAGGTGPGP